MKKKVLASSATTAMLLGVFAPYYISAANPYLPLWEHLPDGEPRVFEDPDNPGRYRMYIIGSHDVRYTDYCGVDIRVWSAPVEDLSDWRDEGVIFSFQDPSNGRWDVMFAPDLVEVLRRDSNGERTIREYYLYPHSRGPGREPMVAKSTSPVGPFEVINLNSDGRTLLSGSCMGFDPSVYIEYIDDPDDPDFDIGFRAYGYWGFQKSHAAQLDQNTMYSVRPGTEVIQYFIPASNSYGDIRDPEGLEYPNVFPGENLGAFNFFEAASIRKVGNKYVWVYSGYSGPDYGLGSTNSSLRYAYGDTPLGPWKSGGVLVDSRAPVINKDGTALQTSYSGHNTHGSIEKIGDMWYVFYHRAPRGFGFARQPMVAPVHITWDETPVANGGKVTIRGWDTGDVPKTFHAGEHEYTGAEVTSEGFHIYGLNPFRYYSAGIACYLSNTGSQSDSWDIWDDGAPLKGVGNGDIVGYKYFGFGGLSENKNGIGAFEGTGRNMKFNLFLMPTVQREFKINIWLDAPWDNDVHKGTKIGEINVPGGLPFEVQQFTADISGHADMLTGKRAIYLVPEGLTGSLCDIYGLGFSADGKDIERPAVPQISITADGTALKLPVIPVRATEENGLTDYSYYEIEAEIPAGASRLPNLAASSDVPEMNITVLQPDYETGVATVVFDYRGAEKIYNITFSPLSNLTGTDTGSASGEQENTPKPSPAVIADEQSVTDGDAEETGGKRGFLPLIAGGVLAAAALCFGVFRFLGKKNNM